MIPKNQVKFLISIILTISIAITIAAVVAIIFTPIFSIIVSVIAGAVAISVLYLIINRILSDESTAMDHGLENVQDNVNILVDKINNIEKELLANNFYLRINTDDFDGASKEVLSRVNRIMDTIFKFMDSVSAVVVSFNEYGQITYFNKMAIEQGFTLDAFLGKTICEVIPSDDSKKITKIIKEVVKTGRKERMEATLISPTGDELIEEYLFNPIKDANGRTIAVTVVNFDLSAIVAKTKKINAYQEFEAADIAKSIREGLAQGILEFNFELAPHDEDTAAAAAAYKQIGDMLSYAVEVIKDYISELSSLLADIAGGNLTVNIEREYIGDFYSIKKSINNISNSLHKTMSEIV
ncbi:MAG: PAS domain-containing protein, partial [Defluviitaleaceae bacterium]|nr:PAS domain-containing protein [Defluviitaleaceae bacterium]